MKLEGWLCGPGVKELDQTWHSLAWSLCSKKLKLDLCDVIFIDEPGKQLLTQIRKQTGADFVANTPMTKHIAEQAGDGNQDNSTNVRKDL